MSEYEKQALDFLRKSRANMSITLMGKAFNENWDDKKLRNVYDVDINTARGNMKVKFWDSIFNTNKKIKPTEYDILACLTKYDPGTFSDFCCEYGYDDDSIRALRTYIAVQKEWSDIRRIFTPEQIEELKEIY